jgi:hypothetical protein
MPAMSDRQPGERGDPRRVDTPDATRTARRLAEAPSARYTSAAPDEGPNRRGLAGPLARAIVAGAIGGAVLVVMAVVLASTFGLLIVAGALGAAIGLLIARTRLPVGYAAPALTPRAATWLSIAIALAAVAGADVATWLIARGEGGTLALVDYLLTTFQLIIPAEAVVAALAAAWGASAGPVQR